MDEITRNDLEALVDAERTPPHIRFRAAVLLLFDTYDPFNPAHDLTPATFFRILQSEMTTMLEHYQEADAAMAMDQDTDRDKDEFGGCRGYDAGGDNV